MLAVISPAKKLDFETPVFIDTYTDSRFLTDSKKLIRDLRGLAPQDISSLMGISDKLGILNHDRYQAWKPSHPAKQSRQALLAFKGDVYAGLDAASFKKSDFNFAQKHLRILSGLYGLLRPLDMIQPYRLEMGTRFANEQGKNLYDFWGGKLAQQLNSDMKAAKSKVLVNLASSEYFKVVKTGDIDADIISPVFKDWKSGQYKVISFFAKKARGMMSAFIIKHRLNNPEQLQDFDWDGYRYNAKLSKPGTPVFTRKQ